MRLRRRHSSFPNPGTDRRPDELERNLTTEAEAQASLERAIETDRVADEDREEGQHRSDELEDLVVRQRRMIDVLALAVLILLCGCVLAGVVVALS